MASMRPRVPIHSSAQPPGVPPRLLAHRYRVHPAKRGPIDLVDPAGLMSLDVARARWLSPLAAIRSSPNATRIRPRSANRRHRPARTESKQDRQGRGPECCDPELCHGVRRVGSSGQDPGESLRTCDHPVAVALASKPTIAVPRATPNARRLSGSDHLASRRPLPSRPPRTSRDLLQPGT